MDAHPQGCSRVHQVPVVPLGATDRRRAHGHELRGRLILPGHPGGRSPDLHRHQDSRRSPEVAHHLNLKFSLQFIN